MDDATIVVLGEELNIVVAVVVVEAAATVVVELTVNVTAVESDGVTLLLSSFLVVVWSSVVANSVVAVSTVDVIL